MNSAIANALFRRGLAREHGFEPLAVEGTLPSALEGTLYRNGPAIFELFGRRYLHPFEGDGAITAVRFAGGRVAGACRITATAQANVWRVQFFNSMDVPILDTFEVTAMPEVVLAADEDLTDSASRLRDVLEAIR